MLTTTPDEQPDFQRDLVAIVEDPVVRNLARRRAGNPDVAEDALQETYYAVSRVRDPDAITNLRAYFCQALIREVYRQLGRLEPAPAEDIGRLADLRQDCAGSSPAALRPVEEAVCSRLHAEDLLADFAARRAELTARVPRRSTDPARYRAAVASAAGHLLYVILAAGGEADFNAPLRSAYPEWFADPACPVNARDQRLLRGRTDVCAFLREIAGPG